MPFDVKRGENVTKEEAIKLIQDGEIEGLDAEFYDDIDVMMRAAWLFPDAIEYASDRLRDNKEFVMATISATGNWNNLLLAGKKVLGNPEVIKQALLYMSNDGLSEFCEIAPEVDIGQDELILKYVGQIPLALKFASDTLRNNPEFVLQLINNAPSHNDKGVSIKLNNYLPLLMSVVGPDVLRDVNTIKGAVKRSYRALKFVDSKVLDDIEIMLPAITMDARVIFYAGPTVKKNNEVAEQVVRQFIDTSMAIKVLDPSIRENVEIMSYAVSKEPNLYKDLSETLRNNPEIIKAAVSRSPEIFSTLTKEQRNDPVYALSAVEKSSYSWRYAGPKPFFGREAEAVGRAKDASMLYYSPHYNDVIANMCLRNMLYTLGIGQLQSLLFVPEIDSKDIEEKRLTSDGDFLKYYKIARTPQGELLLSTDFFGGLAQIMGGNASAIPLLKKINNELDTAKSPEEILNMINNLIPEDKKESFHELVDNILRVFINERMNASRAQLQSRITDNLEETEMKQKATIASIVEKILEKVLKENKGVFDFEKASALLNEELRRPKVDGSLGTFYSPHIIQKKELMLTLIREQADLLGNVTLIGALRRTKEIIGQGWIRKLISISSSGEGIFQEAFEALAKKATNPEALELLMGTKAVPRDEFEYSREDAKHYAYTFEIGKFLSYEMLRTMFLDIKLPEPFNLPEIEGEKREVPEYMQLFSAFFKAKREEILSNPEAIYRFSEIFNNFSMIIEEPGIKEKLMAGKLTINEVLSQLPRGIVAEHDEIDIEASENILEKFLAEARQVFAITRERNYSQIPQFSSEARSDGEYTVRGRMLRADEIMNLFAGNVTGCCQAFGREGYGSMLHAAKSRKGGVFVVEEIDADGKVVRYLAQSWVWRNGNRLCFDNIESPVDFLKESTREMVYVIYKEAAQRAIEIDKKMLGRLLEEGKITREEYEAFVLREVTTGMGHNEIMLEFGRRDETTTIVPVPSDYEHNGWVDSDESVRVLARNNDVPNTVAITDEMKKKEDEILKYRNARMPLEYVGERIPDDRIRTFLSKNGITINIADDGVEAEQKKIIAKTKYDELLDGRIHLVDHEPINSLLPNGQTELEDDEELWDDFFDGESDFEVGESTFISGLAKMFHMNESYMHLTMSADEDWFLLTEETDKHMVIGTLNAEESRDNISKLELAICLYKKLIRAVEKGKSITANIFRKDDVVLRTLLKDVATIEEFDPQLDTREESLSLHIRINLEEIRKKLEELEQKNAELREEMQHTRYEENER